MPLGGAMSDFNHSVRQFRALTITLFVSVLFAMFAVSGCAVFSSSGSVSDSSGSVSDSTGSSSDSSTSSSGNDSAYREDIRTYTLAHVRADGSPEDLRLGLSEIALTRGISNWEALPDTFIAIGAGLAAAGVTSDGLGVYQNALVPAGSANENALRQGFTSATR